MSDANLSRSVAESTRFLRGIHDDVRAMLTALDTLMDRAGWTPTQVNKVSGNLSNGFQGDEVYWVMWWLYRFYIPTAAGGGPTDRLAAVICHFEPFDGMDHDYATLFAAAARFPTPTPPADFYKNWSDTTAALRIAAGQTVPVPLPRAAADELFPGASVVEAFAVPLCELTGAGVLETRIVSPLLAAEAELGPAGGSP